MSFAAGAMGTLNVVIAASYVLLGHYFARRFHPTIPKKTLIALQVFFGTFFVGCAATYLTLSYHTFTEAADWLVGREMWAAGATQAFAGMGALLYLRKVDLALSDEDRRNEIYGTILQAEEMERRRIASDLHDDVVQVMTAALMRLELASKKVGENGALTDLEKSSTALRLAIERTRRMMFNLRPEVLEKYGLRAALEEMIDRESRDDIDFLLCIDIDIRYDQEVETLVYRTLTEVIHNAVKHSKCQSISVVLTILQSDLVILVRDDGCGFDYARAMEQAGYGGFQYGLLTVQERIRIAGGQSAITSVPGIGTDVRFVLPKFQERRIPEGSCP